MNRVKQQIHYWCGDTRTGKVAGRNITVAVLDTGLAGHPDLGGRILAFRDCINGRNSLYDDNGHGTHVGGIIAGNGSMSRGMLSGMAPETRLVAVKVLDAGGEGSVEQILDGIRWIRKNYRRYGIRIVNLSVGARRDLEKKKENCLIAAVEELWDKGLIVIVSAGNYGPEEGSIAVPGNSKKVITVGALGEPGIKNECSGNGPTEQCIVKPEIIAPGYRILSCSRFYSGNRSVYIRKSGTSMATPVVSGSAALLLSKYPEMCNVELKLRFRETCEHMTEDMRQGWGCVRIDHLLESKE